MGEDKRAILRMLRPEDEFVLQKSVWTDADFENMCWHDVHIRAIGSEPGELMLDLDYLFEWVQPEPPSPYFTFWIAPCTMVFHDVGFWSAEVEEYGISGGWEIDSLSRNALPPDHENLRYSVAEPWWVFDLQHGEFCIASSGFTMYTRSQPRRHSGQTLEFEDRGGFSFSRSLGL